MAARRQPSRSAAARRRAHTQAPRPTIKTFAAGQVRWREGEPAGPLYVICSGSVRAHRRSLTVPDSIQELAQLGPGEVVGELAPLLRHSRSATVQALEPTAVIEVPADQLGALVRRHEPLLRVIALALRDRAGLSETEIESAVTRVGGTLPREVFMVESPDAAGGSLPVPPHDRTVAYPKTLTCPACGARFSTLVIHARKDQPAERTSDFHQRYVTPFNPYDYELWVCPNDLYASLPADFGELSDIQRMKVADVVDGVTAGWGGQRPDFNADRTSRLREQGLQLALAIYRMREAPPSRVAAILHRLAWCARERSDTDIEQQWLSQAVEAYSTAYAESDLDGTRDELRVLYLCGELSARLGDTPAALRWFEEALRDPALKDHPNWERMLRDQWAQARATGAA